MRFIASATTAPESIWSEITAGEVVLLVAGAVLTLAIISFFIWVVIRASRDSAPANPSDRNIPRD